MTHVPPIQDSGRRPQHSAAACLHQLALTAIPCRMGGVASEIRLLAVVKTHILEEVRFRLVKQ